VIAFRMGAIPEVVEDGVTGYTVDSEAEAVAAVGLLPQLSRSHIRQRFEKRFTARRMANDYVDVYEAMTRAASPRRRLNLVAGADRREYDGRVASAP
jgi:glycosyltransferase involved in cell wall biosynthesis